MWPYPMIAFYLGRIGEKKLRDAAAKGGETTVRGQQCELDAYLGEDAAANGHEEAAKQNFLEALPLCPMDFVERNFAKRGLVRVVCNNTLQIALGDSATAIKVAHRSQFDAQAVKRQLGIAISSWDAFMARMKALAERKVSDAAAETFFRRVLTYPTTNPADRDTVAVNERAIKAVAQLYAGRGKGADLASASGTACGLVNAVTEFTDHHRRARSEDHRRDAA